MENQTRLNRNIIQTCFQVKKHQWVSNILPLKQFNPDKAIKMKHPNLQRVAINGLNFLEKKPKLQKKFLLVNFSKWTQFLENRSKAPLKFWEDYTLNNNHKSYSTAFISKTDFD